MIIHMIRIHFKLTIMTRLSNFIITVSVAIILATVYHFGYYLGSLNSELYQLQLRQQKLKTRQLQYRVDSLKFELEMLELELSADGETCGL